MPTENIPNAEPARSTTEVSRTDQLFAFADWGTPLTVGQKFLHFWVTVGVGFVRNRCPVRASALAYASLLALVPMLAVIASVAVSLLKNEGEERSKQLIEMLVSNLTAQTSFMTLSTGKTSTAPTSAEDEKTRATRREVVERINEYVTKVRSGALGVTGMVVLLFMAISMLSRIEDTFNDIWGVTRGRSWFARVVQYWAALTLGPLLLMCALALTSSPFFTTTKETIATVRDRTHWNSANIKPRDPVILGLCSQTDLNAMVQQANDRLEREGKAVPAPPPPMETEEAA